MPSADVAWLRMDQPTNLMVITGVLWFETPPDWGRVREVLRARLVEPYPRFRQRVVERQGLAGPHWEDDPDFDLDLHLHRVALPPPHDRVALQALVADLTSTPLDRMRALWQFHLVDEFGEGAAMIARIHHCIADGIALAQVLMSLTDPSPRAGVEPPAPPAERREGGGPLEAVLRPAAGALSAARGTAGAVVHESVEVLRHPSHMTDLAASAREDADALAKVLLATADPPSPLKGDLGVAKRVAWSNPIALEEVRAMGHETGTTINDVIVTAVAGGLRRYLRSRDGLVDELTAFVPFNLRPLDEPLPRDLGNRFGLVSLVLPVGIGDRRRRLREVHRRMQEIKHSPQGAISYGVLDAIGRTPAEIERRAVELFSSTATAVVTNVPGPRQPVYLAGTRVGGVLVWAPCSGNISMTVSIFSYAGEITIGVMADAKLVPDPEAIVAASEREVEALLRLKRRPIGGRRA
ncbi:MAG: wax ester/triacylglycerol synthase family O-acyltransferase [Solirubrobacterales bacterium]